LSRSIGGTIHFRCSLELQPQGKVADGWTSLVKSIRRWISTFPDSAPPITNPMFTKAWFFRGGVWKAPPPGFYIVNTACITGNGDSDSPQYWAARYDHAGSEGGRTWRTDIGVTQQRVNCFRLDMTVSYFPRDNYFGPEIQLPAPFVPRVIHTLLRSTRWHAFSGSERLLPYPHILNIGDGKLLLDKLEDPNRQCPIVLVSRDSVSDRFLIDPCRLARMLVGSAAVYATASSDIDLELEDLLGTELRCSNGTVRIYQPNLRVGSPSEHKRHRFISGRDIKQLPRNHVLDMFVRAIVRRTEGMHCGPVVCIEDIATLDRERRITELRLENKDTDHREWAKLLEEINAELELEQQKKDMQIQELQVELANREETVSRLRRHLGAEGNRVHILEEKEITQRVVMDRIPQNLFEVLEQIVKLFPDRLAVTDRGYRSARKSKFNRLNDAWKCLLAMATFLHELYFSHESSVDIEKSFLDLTGIEFAPNERSSTRADRKLMRQRIDCYCGQKIDITPHVKIDKGTTRIYFAPYRTPDASLLVIGFIGHLDTAGTGR